MSRFRRFMIAYGSYCVPWPFAAVVVVVFAALLVLGAPVVPIAGLVVAAVVQAGARFLADKWRPASGQ